jgi:hypothetical protein
MKLFNKKSRLQQVLETVNDSLDLPGARSKFSLPNIGSTGALKEGISQDTAIKASFVAAGLAGLTAASAGISSLRRAGEARDNS